MNNLGFCFRFVALIKKTIIIQMNDKSHNNDNKPFEMSNINNQFSLSKEINLQPKLDR